MKIELTWMWFLEFTVCLIIGVTLFAAGGVPEPSMVFYGQAADSGGTQLTVGELTCTLTPKSGGSSLTMTGSLSKIEGAGGAFSYVLEVPLETAVAEDPVSANAIGLSAEAVTYTRTMSVKGTDITRSDEVSFSLASRGVIERLDLGPKVQVDPAAIAQGLLDAFAQADGNGDGKLSFEEAQAQSPSLTQEQFNAFDADGDGVVTSAELQQAAVGDVTGVAQDLLDHFSQADTNDDGKLSYDEARAQCPDLTQSQFDAMDTNGDGFLSSAELKEAGAPSCGCPGSKKALNLQDAIKYYLGDWFVLGLACALLLGHGRFVRP